MTIDETKDVIKEVQAPPIESVNKDPMQEILKGMLSMQAKTNETLEKLSDKIDDIATVKEAEDGIKTEAEMLQGLNNRKIIERKMYKVLIIKQVLQMDSQDQQLHGDNFANGGVVRGDTNQWFDTKKEAEAWGEKNSPGKFKLLPVTVPVPEGQEYNKRRPNITI